MWVMTGVRRSGITTTSSPFGRVKFDTAGPQPVVCPLDPARMENDRAASATQARFIAWGKGGLLAWSQVARLGLIHNRPISHGDRRIQSQEPPEYGSITTLSLVIPAGRIELLGFGSFDPARDAVRLVRRRRLVAGRRLGQLAPRRLPVECAGLVDIAAEAPGPQREQAAEIADL